MTPLQQGALLCVLSGRGTHVTRISKQLNKPNRVSVAHALKYLETKGYISADSQHEHGRIEYKGTRRGFEAFDEALGRRGLVRGVSDSPEELARTVGRLSRTLLGLGKRRIGVGVWEPPPKGTSAVERRIRLEYLSVSDLVSCLEDPAEPIPDALAVTPESLSVLFAASRGIESTLGVAEYTGLAAGWSSWGILQKLSARRLVERRRVGQVPADKGEPVYVYPLTVAGQWALVLGLIRGGLPAELFGNDPLVGLDPLSAKLELLVDPVANVSSGPAKGRARRSSAVQTPNRLSVLWTIPDDLPPVHVGAIERVTGLSNINIRNATGSFEERGLIERIVDSRAKSPRFAFVRGPEGRGVLQVWRRRRGLAPGLVQIAGSQLRDKHLLTEGTDPLDWLSRELLTGQVSTNLFFPASRWTPEFSSVVLATFINPHLGLEPMTHAQIQEYTGVGAGTVSGALKALVQAGLLERRTAAGQGWGAAKWLETYALEPHAWPLLGQVLSLRGFLPSVAPQALATQGAHGDHQSTPRLP